MTIALSVSGLALNRPWPGLTRVDDDLLLFLVEVSFREKPAFSLSWWLGHQEERYQSYQKSEETFDEEHPAPPFVSQNSTHRQKTYGSEAHANIYQLRRHPIPSQTNRQPRTSIEITQVQDGIRNETALECRDQISGSEERLSAFEEELHCRNERESANLDWDPEIWAYSLGDELRGKLGDEKANARDRLPGVVVALGDA
jgi:hypothetical protein